VLQCGKQGSGGHLSGMRTLDNKRITYACKQCRGVSIRAEHVEPLLYRLVGGQLANPHAVDLLKSDIHDEAEPEAIGQRLLTGQQAKIATDLINSDIAKLERQQLLRTLLQPARSD
jgi:hypothetical protein